MNSGWLMVMMGWLGILMVTLGGDLILYKLRLPLYIDRHYVVMNDDIL